MSNQALKVNSAEDLNSLVVSVKPDIVLEMFMSHFELIIYRIIVRFLATHNCKDPKDHGEDVRQNTFIAVFKEFCAYYASLKSPGFTNPGGWVNSIAIRYSFRHFAQECGNHDIDIGDFNTNTSEDNGFLFRIINEESKKSSRAGSVQANLEAEEILDSIEEYLSELSSIKQAAFILRMNGANHKEIGEALNMTESATAKMVNRIMFKINQKYNT